MKDNNKDDFMMILGVKSYETVAKGGGTTADVVSFLGLKVLCVCVCVCACVRLFLRVWISEEWSKVRLLRLRRSAFVLSS
mmetsp:Transcript_18447/g.34337  ORF Transcript_18447/g.34337 Transcript_18447/m.34337 type:complete len:80 (+) Transcript_18447:779-1018(+)